MLGSLMENNMDAIAVSMNFIGKDIIGQSLSLPIMNKISKMEHSKILKSSLLIYEVSIFLECCTPLMGNNYFIYLASLGNIGKNIGFTGYGAFNAHYINKMSPDKDNISEIYSKVSIFSSIFFSAGMICGLGIVRLIPDHTNRLMLLPFLGILRYLIISYFINSIK